MSKKPTLIIKRGIAVFPALNRPDTKFVKTGQYKADIKLPFKTAEPYMKQIAAHVKEILGKAPPIKKDAKGLWSYETDDEGEETGNVIFLIKIKNVKTKEGTIWDRRPFVIDSKKKELTGINIWGGSVLSVKIEIDEWEFEGSKGVSLRPRTVQVIELVTGDGDEPDIDGFDEEDGYEGTGADTSGFDDEDDGEDAGDPNDPEDDDDEDY